MPVRPRYPERLHASHPAGARNACVAGSARPVSSPASPAVGAEELDQVAFGAVELSRFPVQLYRNPLQTVLTVVPVAFLTTFPAQALLGRLEPALLLGCPAVSLVAVTLARLLWRRSLRHYAGASA